MRALVWDEAAENDLVQILDYIAYDSPQAALSLKAGIDRAIAAMLEFPDGFWPGRIAGTREMVVHPNYIVIYRVLTHAVQVVSVLHARREYP
ncbi:MAG TPA: type II toxin-antitoxin system RelE/ParE family toxin [Devosia sp.]|nr:type II toxin-antitoxin system RelE/ParE family toxin [Devosia sp.]